MFELKSKFTTKIGKQDLRGRDLEVIMYPERMRCDILHNYIDYWNVLRQDNEPSHESERQEEEEEEEEEECPSVIIP